MEFEYLKNYEKALFTCPRSEKYVFSIISATNICVCDQQNILFRLGIIYFLISIKIYKQYLKSDI
jgi:hypothetical protein